MSLGAWAVVVNWNGGEGNLDSVRSLLDEGLVEERIVFVDNASTDGSREAVEEAFPGLRLVQNGENLGYGRGCNQGIEVCREGAAELVLLVNNDLTLASGCMERLMVALASLPDVGVVGPRIVFKDRPDVLWCAGGRMTYRQNLSVMLGHGMPDAAEFQRTFEVDYVAGAAMLVRARVFDDVGVLDAEYFAYHEDVEFCLKAREAGYRVVTVGEALALHAAHGSTGGGYNPRRKYMMGVNTVWFLRRHGTPARWLSFLVFDVLSLPFVWVYRALRGEGRGVVAKAHGTFDGLRGRRVTDDFLRAAGKG